MAFLQSFWQYICTMIFLAVIAGLGIFAGKKLRDRKDAKTILLEDSASSIQKED